MHPDPASWYVLIGDRETGPLTRVELGVELATGAVAQGSLVWKEGMADWLPGLSVPELASLFRNPPRSPRATGARAPGNGASPHDFDATRAQVPKRIAPGGTRTPTAVGRMRRPVLEEEFIPEAVIVEERDYADIVPTSSRAITETQPTTTRITRPASPRKTPTPAPPISIPRSRPEQGWASLALTISGAVVLASSLLWYAIAVG